MIRKTLFAIALSVAAAAQDEQANWVQLRNTDIRVALTGNLVYYSPPGWSDAGAHEEFRKDGSWRGTRYGRGPFPFSGKWTVRSDQLCVRAAQGLWEKRGGPDWYCRKVWRDPKTGALHMDHLTGGFAPSPNPFPQLLTVRPLPPG